LAAYRESVMLADGTQGGISLSEALAMPHSQRRATIQILQEFREKQAERIRNQQRR
jgi:hypothetical protein